MIAIDLRKQQALETDPKAIQQINFIGNLDSENNKSMFFITEELKEAILDFWLGTVRVLWISLCHLVRVAKVSDCKVSDRTPCSTILFCFNIISI